MLAIRNVFPYGVSRRFEGVRACTIASSVCMKLAHYIRKEAVKGVVHLELLTFSSVI